MTDIEFLDPGPVADHVDAMPDPNRPSSDRAWLPIVGRFAPAALWSAAAALAVLAPFQLVYGISVRAADFGQDSHADGWGRMGGSDLPFPEHETRYGIVQCVAAGLLVVAAGLAVLSVVGRRSVRDAPRSVVDAPRPVRARLGSAGAGVAGLALLAGTAATALLYVDSIRDNIAVQLRSADFGSDGLGSPARATTVHVTFGWMLWLTAIAVGCGLIALVLQALPVAAAPIPEPWSEDGPEVPPALAPALAPEFPPTPAFGAPAWPDPQDELLESGPRATGSP